MNRINLEEKYYAGSGVKTLRTVGTIMLILGIVGALALIPTWIIGRGYAKSISPYGVTYSIAVFISGFFMQGLCRGIATIAECQLYKKAEFEDKKIAEMKTKEEQKKTEEEGEVQ